MDNQKMETVYVFSTSAAQLEKVSSCLEEVDNSTLLLKLHRLCTDALLVFNPDSDCQSHEEAHHLAAVPKIAAMLLEVLNAYANMFKDSGSEISGSYLWFWQDGRNMGRDQQVCQDYAQVSVQTFLGDDPW